MLDRWGADRSPECEREARSLGFVPALRASSAREEMRAPPHLAAREGKALPPRVGEPATLRPFSDPRRMRVRVVASAEASRNPKPGHQVARSLYSPLRPA